MISSFPDELFLTVSSTNKISIDAKVSGKCCLIINTNSAVDYGGFIRLYAYNITNTKS